MTLVACAGRANPSGGTVAAGSASITGGAGELTITQQSGRAIINWRDFSIGAGELTRFVQPDAASAVLNRVIGGDPSTLLGHLQANGRVYLLNPSGILVGAGARIDTAGFLASTLDVADTDFLKGGDLLFKGGSTAAVQNLGAINALGGDVFLIARKVENAGAVTAANGTAGLAAGSEVLLTTGGDERVFVQAASAPGEAVNAGTLAAATAELKAAGGNAYALAIANTGVVRATGSAVRDGQVWLVATGGGAVESAGTLAAVSADGARGGEVRVLGGTVTLAPGAQVDVSGAQAGGTALIGGGYQGENPAVSNAHATTVGAGATLRADGAAQGGEVVVWSDGDTRFDGAISARGAQGGLVEVSGRGALAFGGSVATGNGTLLLDPTNIVVQAADGDEDASFGTGQLHTLLADNGNVTLAAAQNITWNSDATLDYDGLGGSHLLTLQAGNAITMHGQIHDSVTGGGDALNVSFIAGGGIVQDAGSIDTQGGNVSFNSGGVFNQSAGASILTGGGGFTSLMGPGGTLSGQIATGAGTLSVTAQQADTTLDLAGGSFSTTTGAMSFTVGTHSAGGAKLDLDGALLTTADGSITLNDSDGSGWIATGGSSGSTVSATGAGTITFNNANITFWRTGSTISANGGDITLNTGGLALGNAGAGLISNPAGQVTLNSTAGAGDDVGGTIVANSLLLTGSGDVTLDNATNAVGTLAADIAGALTFANGAALTVGAIDGTSGVTATGAVSLTTTAGDLTVNQAVATADKGEGEGNSGGIALQAAGALMLAADVRTGSAINAAAGVNNDVTSGSIALQAGTSITGTGRIATGSATGTRGSTGHAHATSGSITATAGGALGLGNANALVTGTASGDDPGDLAVSGGITLTAGTINAGAAGSPLALTIGAAGAQFGSSAQQGSLSATLTGAAGELRIGSGSALTVGSLATPAGSAQTVDIAVTGGATLTLADAARTVAGDDVTLDAGTGVLTFSNPTTPFDIGAGSLTLSADAMNLAGGANSITGTGGALLVQPSSPAASMGLGTGPGTLQLDAAALGAFADGFSGLVFGRADGSGAVTIGDATFKDDVTIRAPSGAGSIALDGALATGSGTEAGSITLQAGAGIVGSTGGSITTQGRDITLNSDRDASGDGSISLTGVSIGSHGGDIVLGGGGDPAATAAKGATYGVLLGGTLDAGSGAISIRGEATGTTGNNNYGVNIEGGTVRTGGAGGITITGTGAPSAGNTNYGVYIDHDALVQSSGAGSISITGTGGGTTGSFYNDGVAIHWGGVVTSAAGAIDITGTAGVATGANTSNGISFQATAGKVESTGGASITLTGTGAGPAGVGLYFGNASTIGGANDTGAITLTADSVNFVGNPGVQSSGALLVQPQTAAASIGIGSSSASGTLALPQTALNAFADGFSSITIGRANGSGAVTVGDATFNDDVTLRAPEAGGTIAITGDLAATGSRLTLDAAGQITATGAVDVGAFTLAGGNWVQDSATLPAFSAGDFTLAGGTFLRAAGGDGSAATPYLLADVYGLQGMKDFLAKDFTLAADIDASGTAAWNGGAGFAPIGTGDLDFSSPTFFNAYAGIFDGAGHTITGLTMNRPDVYYAGLFGMASGTIENVGLVGGSVTAVGATSTGGLIGSLGTFSAEGQVSNSYTTGAVTGGLYGNTGGLVGELSAGDITRSHAAGTVTGGEGGNTGGLVGVMDDGTLTQSYATGAVSGGSYVGGLVGNENDGTIRQAYAWGDVTSAEDYAIIGGLVGNQEQFGTAIDQGYASGAVSATGGFASAAGLVGRQGSSSAIVTDSYWDDTVNSSAALDNGLGAPRSTAQLQDGLYATVDGFDPAVWSVKAGRYPVFRWGLPEVTVSGTFTGAGAQPLALVLGGGIVATTTSDGGGAFTFTFRDDHGADTPALIYAAGAGTVPGNRTVLLPAGDATGVEVTPDTAWFQSGAATLTGLIAELSALKGGLGDTGILFDTGGGLAVNDGIGVKLQLTNAVFTLDQAWDLTGHDLEIDGAGALGATASLAVDHFTLTGGDWVQNAATLPAFSATDFTLAGGTFLRATGGDGTTGAPYQLADVYGLQGAATLLDKAFALANNIDAGGTAAWNGGAGFAPIGYDYAHSYTGVFDGRFHTISGLTINQTAMDLVGLFGETRDATIKNVVLEGVSLNATNAIAGGLVGYLLNGSVSASYATGTVSADLMAGGLVGEVNGGSVDQSYADVTVTGTGDSTYAGGLAGYATNATLTQVYATGAVTSGGSFGMTGGLLGYQYGGSLAQSYETGAVSGGGLVGGLVGVSLGSGAVTSSYWDQTVNSDAALDNGHGTGRTTGELHAAATFTGWDLDAAGGGANVWRIYEGNTAPLLKAFLAPLTVTGGDVTVTYDGSASHALGAGDYTTSTTPEAGGLLGTASYVASSADAGAYTDADLTLTGLYSSQQGYDITPAAGSLTVNPKGITVTADTGQEKIYGNADPALAYTVNTGGLVVGDTLSGALDRAAGEDAGAYAIGQGTLTDTNNPNYAITFTGADFTITPRPITIAANAGQGKTYGADDPAAAATAYAVTSGSLAFSQSLAGDMGRVAGETVGGYAFTQGAVTVDDGNGGANYAITFDGTTHPFVIAKADLTATFANQSKVYGQDDPALSGIAVTLGGVVNRTVTDINGNTTAIDDSDAVATTLTGLTRDAGEAVGGYAITGAGFNALAGASAGNYSAPVFTGSPVLTITPAALIAGIASQSKVYGDGDPALSGIAVTLGGLVNRTVTTWNGNVAIDDSGAVTATLAGLTRDTGETVGGYAITGASFNALAGVSAGNYSAPVLTGSPVLTVTKRPITLTADATGKVYGDADGPLSVSITGGSLAGVAVTDTLADVTGILSREAGENAGAYGILLGAGAKAADYDVTFDTGNLAFVITPAPLTITADGRTKTYGDTVTFAGTEFSADGLKNDEAVGSVALSSVGAAATADVGGSPYAITASGATGGTFDAGNYTITYADGALTVTPKEITVTAAGGSSTYGDTGPANPGFTAGGLVNGQTESVLTGLANDFAITNTTGAGDYTLSVTGTLTNGNYTVTERHTGTWTVDPKGITVTADAGQEKIYGNADPALAYTVNTGGLVNGDTLSGALDRAAGEDAGAYAIGQGTLTDANNPNYAIAFTGADFTITPRAITVTADDKTRAYGAADPALTFAIGGLGLASGDTAGSVFTGGLERVAGETVAGGPYAITQGSLAANGNYAVTFTAGVLTITPAALLITANDATRIYGYANPAFSATFAGLVNGDTSDVVSGLQFSTPATEASLAGTYAITPSSASAANYTISYAEGTLSVVPPVLLIGGEPAPVPMIDNRPLITSDYAVVERDGRLMLVPVTGPGLGAGISEDNALGVSLATAPVLVNGLLTGGFIPGGYQLVPASGGTASAGGGEVPANADPNLFRETSIDLGRFRVIYQESLADAGVWPAGRLMLATSFHEFPGGENPRVLLLRRAPGAPDLTPDNSTSPRGSALQ